MTETGDVGGDRIQLVTVRVADQVFALNVLDVEKVVLYEPTAVLPDAPAYCDGRMPFRDDSIPLVDLRKRFEVPAPIVDTLRVVVVSGAFGRRGLIVDAALWLQSVPASAIVVRPRFVRGLTADYVAGIVGDGEAPIVVLNVSKLISSTERIVLRPVEVGAEDE